MCCYEMFPGRIVGNAMQSVFILVLKSPPLEMELLIGSTRFSGGTFILHLYFPLVICYQAWLVAQSCLTLCNPVDCSPPDSFVHGIFQARTLEWAPSPGDLPDPGIETVSLMSPALAGWFFTTRVTWETGICINLC